MSTNWPGFVSPILIGLLIGLVSIRYLLYKTANLLLRALFAALLSFGACVVFALPASKIAESLGFQIGHSGYSFFNSYVYGVLVSVSCVYVVSVICFAFTRHSGGRAKSARR